VRISDFIRDVPDFPRPGIVFKDITPLLNDTMAFRYAFRMLMEQVEALGLGIDKVVGIESRGFLMGPMLAREMQLGFIPVRKPNKLPYETRRVDYALEYGTSSLEMHVDAIRPGDRVLIHDDVLATGGTAEAAGLLVSEMGGQVVHFNFLLELSILKGKERLTSISGVQSLLQY